MAKETPKDVPREFVAPTDEPAFLPHPLLDQLLETVIALGAELWVERDRRMALEAVLVERGVIDADAVENHRPDESEQSRRSAARSALVKRTIGGLKDVAAEKTAGD